jgi:DNA-binding LytR/AlgR family response regulator
MLNRFLQAMDKVRDLLESRKQEVKNGDDEFLFFRDSNMVRRVHFDEILFAEAMGDYVKIHTEKKFYAIHATLKSVEERLPAKTFQRVHRSYVVSISKIDTVRDGALIISGKPVPVADAYRSALNKRMNIL